MLTASGVARKLAQKVHAAKGSGYQCIVLISLRKAQEKFSPSFVSYQDGLSWHLCG